MAFRRNLKWIVSLSIVTASCTSPSSEAKLEDPYETYKPLPHGESSYLHLGEVRRAAAPFKSELTVFVRAEDPTPRCPGCRALRVVYQPEDAKAEVITHVRVDLADACDAASPEEPIALPNDSAEGGDPMKFDANPFACDQDGEVGFELLGRACGDPEDPACEDLEVKKTLRAKILDVQRLKPVPKA